MSWYNRLMRKSLLFGLFSFLLFVFIPLFSPRIVLAQDADPVSKQLDIFKQRRSGNQMNLETWYSGRSGVAPDDPSSIGFSQIVLLDLYSRMNGQTINFSNPADIKKLLLGDSGNIFTPLAQTPPKTDGIISQLSGIIGLAFRSPPVSSHDYLASLGENMSNHGIVQPAYAQGTGFGFQNLLPVLEIWKAFRNVAYFAFILVFVLYGFMIMFRMKINPQNVATFESAIPKIVTTLILITFAYAIAGFMMDLMLLVFNLILSIFESSGIIHTTNPVGKLMVQIGSGQAGVLVSGLFSMLTSIAYVPSALINVLTNLPGWLSVALDILLSATGIGLIIRIIIIIAVGYSYVKLIFKLFEAYITIIFQVIFSPLILLQDVLPGSQAFGDWLRNIIANLSVFPTSMIMFLLSYIFMIQPLLSITGGGGLSGVSKLSTAGGLNMPLISGLGTGLGMANSDYVMTVIGFFIILMASKYVDMVRDALKVPPFKYGTAIGEALNFGYNANIGLANRGSGYSTGIQAIDDRTRALRERLAGQTEAVQKISQSVTNFNKPQTPDREIPRGEGSNV